MLSNSLGSRYGSAFLGSDSIGDYILFLSERKDEIGTAL